MGRPRRHDGEHGQAALMLVVLLTIIISVFGGILAETAIQHDPIVQKDTIDHYAYRALEAGINTFISKANDNPNLIACNSSSTPGGQCAPGLYLNWKKVASSTATATVPEYYAWGDPRYCYTQVCGTSTTDTSKPVLYVKEAIYGAAGIGSRMSYQSSTVNVKPVNGFLTRIWWSRYEATDPHDKTLPPSSCTYNYAHGTPPAFPATYHGPNLSSSPTTQVCSPVYFAPGTHVYGPIFSDDSIYITGSPTLGPVATHDPTCLFVTGGQTYGARQTCTSQSAQASTPVVNQTATSLAADQQGAPPEIPPTYDQKLPTYASLGGCVYTGPTTIEFHAAGTMTVWSPETPERPATGTKPECPSTHYVHTGITTKVSSPTTGRQTAVVPNGVHGNGVIYVQTAPTGACIAGANPFDDYTKSAGANGPHAQYVSSGGTMHAAYLGWASNPDCEGDAFVSDAPSEGGIKGQLTVAAGNNVIVTGTLKYTDCGAGFNSTKTHPCRINTGSATNDSLGLVGLNYVLVSHPVVSCTTYNLCRSSLASPCPTSVMGTPTAAVCDPSHVTTPAGITIDAAVLGLQHSFAVDSEGLTTYGCWGAGGPDGTLKVYGSIDQIWRGAVGCVGTSGFTKYYDWNAEGAVITPPYYLAPGMPSWAVGSSAITVDRGPPTWCYAITTTVTPHTKTILTKYVTTPVCNPTG